MKLQEIEQELRHNSIRDVLNVVAKLKNTTADVWFEKNQKSLTANIYSHPFGFEICFYNNLYTAIFETVTKAVNIRSGEFLKDVREELSSYLDDTSGASFIIKKANKTQSSDMSILVTMLDGEDCYIDKSSCNFTLIFKDVVEVANFKNFIISNFKKLAKQSQDLKVKEVGFDETKYKKIA